MQLKKLMFKLFIVLLLPLQVYSQHYNTLLVYVDKKFVEQREVNVHFNIIYGVLYINYDKTLYEYAVDIDTINGTIIIEPDDHSFTCMTDETKDVMALIKYKKKKLFEFLYIKE
jgi:hypothetical protein